jgi:hypothetical protein
LVSLNLWLLDHAAVYHDRYLGSYPQAADAFHELLESIAPRE